MEVLGSQFVHKVVENSLHNFLSFSCGAKSLFYFSLFVHEVIRWSQKRLTLGNLISMFLQQLDARADFLITYSTRTFSLVYNCKICQYYVFRVLLLLS